MNRFLVSLIVSIFIAGPLFVSVQDGGAVIYRYVNDNGTVCFADRQQAIPDKYRGSAVIVNTGLLTTLPAKAAQMSGKSRGPLRKTSRSLQKD